jgi:hypothetical protein
VITNHTGITVGGLSGKFQLNAFKPLITSDFLRSVRLLSDAMRSLVEYFDWAQGGREASDFCWIRGDFNFLHLTFRLLTLK